MNVSQVVQTVFTAAGVSGFVSSLGNVSGAANKAAGALGGLSSILAPLGAIASVAGITELGHKIIDIGDSFENAKTQIGGFMTALNMVPTMADGLKTADSVLRKITIDTAAMPITAESAIEVFKTGLAAVSKASHLDVKGITAFTNKFTSIANTLGVDAGEAGMAINKMLSGTAIQRSPIVMKLMMFINAARRARHQAELTVGQFNALGGTKAFAAMQEGMAGMDPMLKEMQNSWQAQSTAFSSFTKLIFRLSTSGAFEKMKGVLSSINSTIVDANGNLTPFANNLILVGRTISTTIISAFEKASDVVGELSDQIAEMGDSITKSPGFKMIGQGLASVRAAAGTAVSNIRSGMSGPGTGGGVATATAVSGLDVLGKRFQIFTSILDPVSKSFSTIAGYGTDLWQTFLQLQDAANIVLQPLFAFGGEVIKIATIFYDRLRPTVQKVETAFSHLWHSGAKVLAPVIRILGAILGKVASYLGTVFAPVIQSLGQAFAWLIERLSDLLDWIGKKIEAVAPKGAEAAGGPSIWDEFANTWEELKKDLDKKDDDVAAAAVTPATPAGAGTYQDFRGSKFDITQKFAEGFDPDRIAVSFAQDLGRIGENPLQSGHEPLMGVR